MLKKIRNWFIDRIPLSTRLHIGRVLIVLLPALTVAKPTLANPFALGGLIAGAALLLSPGIKAMFGGVVSVILGVISTLTNLMISVIDYLILPGQNSVLFNPIIQEVWQSMQTAANVLFFVAILAMSIMIITRSGGYNFKKAITSLITAVVLANFSFIIVRALVEAGDALRNSAATVFGLSGTGTKELVGLFYNLESLNGWGTTTTILGIDISGVSLLEYMLTGIFLIAVSLIGLYIFFRLAFILIERAVRLILQAIFAPFIFALSVLPAGEFQKMQSKWWSDTIRWVLVLPLAFLLFGIAHKLMVDFQLPSVNQLIITGATNTGELIFAILIIAILLAAANVHTMLEVPLSSATKFFTDTVGNLVPNLVGGAIKTGGAQLGRLAKQKIGKTGIGRWWEKKITVPGKRLDTRIVAGEEVKAMRVEDIAGGMAAKDWNKISKTYDEQFKVWYTKAGKTEKEVKADTSLENDLKRQFREVNPELADNYETIKKEHITHRIRHMKRIEDYKEDPTTAMEYIEKFLHKLDDVGPDKIERGYRDDNDGRIAGVLHRANATGPNGDKWKRRWNDLVDKIGEDKFEILMGKSEKGLNHPWPLKKGKFAKGDFHVGDKYDEKISETEDTGTASGASSDEQLIKGWGAKEKYQEAQQAQQDAAQGVDDSGFTATVESVKNLEGGSAILQIIQQAAESDNPETLKNIASVAELLAKLSPDSEPKISDIQSRYGSDKDAIKTALQSEIVISEEDSEKAASLLSSIGVKDISKVSSVADSIEGSKEDGKLKAKVDYIHQVQTTTQIEKEYRESQTADTTAESTAVNEQRIKAATSSDTAEPYPIQEIRDDIQEATQQLRQIILQSSKDKPEQLRTYQRKLLGQIQHSYRDDLKKLTTKIFGKLKHLHNGSIIDSEDQIDRMTPKEIYRLLAETEASADKLSGGGK